MITVPELAAEALGSFLSNHLERRFGSTEAGLTELISWVSRLALECIGNSDALYHTVEHTMLVTLVGHDIMTRPLAVDADIGRRLCACHRRLPDCTTSAMCAACSWATVPTAMSSTRAAARRDCRAALPTRR